MSRPPTPAAWKRTYEQTLQGLDLVSWTLEMDDGEMLEGQQPEKGHPDWRDWYVKYSKVRIALEGALGDFGEAIEHPLYAQLSTLAPIKERIQVLQTILSQTQQAITPILSPAAGVYTLPSLVHQPLPASEGQSSSSQSLPNSAFPSSSSRRPVISPSSLSPMKKRMHTQPDTPTPADMRRTSGLPLLTRPMIPPRSTLSSASPEPAIASRVYSDHLSVSIGTARLREACKQVTNNAWTYGSKCARCGLTDLADKHQWYNCGKPSMSTPMAQPIITKVHKSEAVPRRHLIIDQGTDKGTMICMEWNTVKTDDGLCYQSHCQLSHICSLCFSPAHRSFDCDNAQYLPLVLTARPHDLPPSDPEEAYRAYSERMNRNRQSNRFSRPPSSSGSMSPSRALMGATSGELMPPPAFLPPASRSTSPVRPSSSASATGSATRSLTAGPSTTSARPRMIISSLLTSQNASVNNLSSSSPTPTQSVSSLQKCKILDSHFALIPRGPVLPPPTTRAMMSLIGSPQPTSMLAPIRYDPYASTSSARAHAYPSEVPSSILPRPGYKSRFFPKQLKDGAPAIWHSRLDYTMARASTTQSFSPSGLAQQRLKDDSLKQRIFDEEKRHNVIPSHWDLPLYGRVGDKRFQYCDGDATAAGIVLMPNYPPAHGFPAAFTPSADGGRMLAAGGLSSPTLTGNAQIAYTNAVPLFFMVDPEQSSMTIPQSTGPSRKSYPKGMQAFCVKIRAQEILDRIDGGAAQMIFSFGSNPREVCDTVISLANSDSIKYETTQIVLSCRDIRLWETGGLSVFGLMLRNRFMNAAPGTVDANVDLVGDAYYDKLERDMVAADRHSPHQALRFVFTLVSSTAHRDRCTVLLSSDHMTLATDVPYKPDIAIGVKLDLTLTFIQDVFFARHITGLYPPPDWRFSKRKIVSTLKDKPYTNSVDVGLSLKEIDIVYEVQRILALQGRQFSPAALYGSLASIFAALSVEDDENGQLINKDDCLSVILAASIARKAKAVRIRSMSITSDATSSTSRPPSSTSAAPTPIDLEQYPTICECGLKSVGNEYALPGIVVVREAIVSTGKGARHRPTGEKAVGDSCLMGIPAGDRRWAQWARVCMNKQRKPREQKELDKSISERILAAWDKYAA